MTDRESRRTVLGKELAAVLDHVRSLLIDGTLVALIIRMPDEPEAGMIITNDTYDAIIGQIEWLRADTESKASKISAHGGLQ